MDQFLIISHIYHSCFTVEIDDYYFVFDYFKGNILYPRKKKKVVYIATHGHDDHFNSKILDGPDFDQKIYILSDDIKALEKKDNIIELTKTSHLTLEERKQTCLSSNVTYVRKDQRLTFDDFKIATFGSTDQGISILLEINGIHIFHAGDLNQWVWPEDSSDERQQMISDFQREVHKVASYPVDIAFFPVDPRLGDLAFDGARYFIDKVQPQIVFPMHFKDDYQWTEEAVKKLKTSRTDVRRITGPNMSLTIDIK